MSMRFLAQLLVVSRLTVAGLRHRPGASLVITIGMACVVAVLISMLSVGAGMLRVLRASADPSRVVVLSTHAQDEHGTELDRGAIATILDAPGMARAADGRPLADAEVLVNVPPAPGFVQGSLNIRGIGPKGLALRPELQIVAGRVFVPGRHELIVGTAARHDFHMGVGDHVIMPDGEWPIVGAFSGGGVLQSQLMTDADTLMAAIRQGGFGSVVARLESPASFEAFRRWLTGNPVLEVTALRQADYYIRAGGEHPFYETMGYFVAGLMSVGALLGAVNILYTAVRARTREIAILRAVGYGPLPLAISVTVEALCLSLLGALLGGGVAWLVCDGRESIGFTWSVTPRLVALGIAWASVLALLGSVLPAIRAAHLPVSAALHE
jgi:putative ABC transport system permease protein